MSSNLVCLLIDDDIDDHDLFRLAMSTVDTGVIMQSATKPLEELARLTKIESGLPDLIFVDVNMPKLNGLDFLKSIKTLSSLRSTPVILVSTSPDHRIEAEVQNYPEVEFLLKPAGFQALVKELTRILTKYKRVNE